MRHRIAFAAALLAAVPAFAQGPVSIKPKTPVAELFGGFGDARFNDSGQTTNAPGIVGSFAWNIRPWMQVVADSSYNLSSYNGVNLTLYGNHYGARFFYRERNKWRISPFAEFLIGGSHMTETASGVGGLSSSDLAISFKTGGGFDYNLTPHFAVRAIDVDYYRTSLFTAHQNNIWFSSGFVIRLGGARPE